MTATVGDLGLISNVYQIGEASGRTDGADRAAVTASGSAASGGAPDGRQDAFLRHGRSTRQSPAHTAASDLLRPLRGRDAHLLDGSSSRLPDFTFDS